MESSEMNDDVKAYNDALSEEDRAICGLLARVIDKHLKQAENKVWHSHPVWFLEGNPIVGYSKQKPGIRLMFWSGADFDEEGLKVRGAKFKDASIFYTSVSEVIKNDLKRWLDKSKVIQWDYKNLIRRKGKLERFT